ncbi:MAG: chemotaxis protein CheW [bacterium]|nr:MAG: chemotaxis protein CheW [bacterium]
MIGDKIELVEFGADVGDQPEDSGHGVILFTIGSEYFALPLEDIAEIHRTEEITPLPLAPEFLLGVINVHGILSSVIHIAKIMNVSGDEESELLIRLIPERGGISLMVGATMGMARYSFLEEVTREISDRTGQVTFVEGIFRSGERLVSLINPEKLRVWIDAAFSKGEL